ncbi:MAG: helix-turn-helix transcriptional regulator [Maricaulaceae bacterium]|jgi:transcriptional regulator with XRE-family HTH domain
MARSPKPTRTKPGVCSSEDWSVDARVGDRIRMRRNLLGVSQQALGAAIGISFQQIQKYENGANRIGASRLVQIAKALDTPVSYFFEGVERTSARATRKEAQISAFLSSADGARLTAAWLDIEDAGLRQVVLDLVQRIAKTSLAGPEEKARRGTRTAAPRRRAPGGPRR